MVAFRHHMLLLAVPAALVAGGCASSSTAGAGSGAAAPSGSTAGPQRWSATLRQLSMSNNATLGGGGGAGATATSYGSITISPVGDTRGRMRYELSVTAPTMGGQQIAWGIFTGACNAPSPPVVPVNELPPIDIASSGAGVVRGEFSVPLDPATTYHVNVYTVQRATDVNNVLLCAKLGYSGPR
jgi:hypothetical protein